MRSPGFSFLVPHQLDHAGLSTSHSMQLFNMELYLGSMESSLYLPKPQQEIKRVKYIGLCNSTLLLCAVKHVFYVLFRVFYNTALESSALSLLLT